jgi:hypothetical protein
MVKKENKITDDCVNDKCCTERRAACEKVIDIKFAALKDTFETKSEATEKALLLATEVINERLNKSNEIRQMAIDRETSFVNKSSYDAQVLNIEQLRLNQAKLSGKADQEDVDRLDKRAEAANNRGNMAIVISIVSLLLAFAIHFIK